MKRTTVISFFFLSSMLTFSQSIAQWRGPDRTGIYPETGLLSEWPDKGPDLLWSADGIGKGFSSAVSNGNMIFVTGMKIWPGAPHTNTITPLFHEGMLYITGGYNHVGAMFSLSEDASSINLLWTDTTLDCHHGGVVLTDGNIYGSNWFDNARGNWCSIDWKTGKMNYSTNWFTKGSIIYADGMLYCYDEKNGNLGLVKARPKEI